MRVSDGTESAEVWRVDRIDHARCPLLFAVDRRDALVCVAFDRDARSLMRHAARHGANLVADTRRPRSEAYRQLREYVEGARTSFDLRIRPMGTAFQRDVWTALRNIPYGETRTYSEIAQAVGRPTAIRAVGAANGDNPLPVVVPCHRVIGQSGRLTGFAGGLPLKRFLLDLENPQRSLPLGNPAREPSRLRA